jgi:cell shape-determining protein MreC
MPAPTKRQAARVIARPPRTSYDVILLDQGAFSGVSVGDEVVYDNIALGKIITVDQGTSLAELFSSPGSAVDALLGNPVAVSVAKGMGGGSFELTVPNDVHLSAGDPVRIEGSSSLLLGIVGSVSAAPTGAAQTISFHAPLSLADLDFVSILQ